MGYLQAVSQSAESLVNPLWIMLTLLHYMNVKHRPNSAILTHNKAVFTQPLDYAEHSIMAGLGKNSQQATGDLLIG